MQNAISLAIIKRLVANGQLDADDVTAICEELPKRDKSAVMAAWIDGSVPNGNEDFKPVLRVVD